MVSVIMVYACVTNLECERQFGKVGHFSCFIHTKKAFTMCVNAQPSGKLNTLGLKLETVEQLQENKCM